MKGIGAGFVGLVLFGALFGCQAKYEDQARATAAAHNAESAATAAEASTQRLEQSESRAEAAAQRAEAVAGKVESEQGTRGRGR